MQHPLGVTFVPSTKSLVVADSYNHKLKIIKDLDQRVASCHTIKTITTNEPGGLSLSTNGSTLYVADTNNHKVQSIDLDAYTNREFQPVIKDLDCTDEGKPKGERFDIDLPNNSGILKLQLQLKVTSSTHLNNEAPNSWKITLPSGWENKSGLKGPIECNNLLCFDIHYNFDESKANDNDGIIALDIKAYLCNDNDGTCFSTQKKHIISCRKSSTNYNNDNCSFNFPVHLV